MFLEEAAHRFYGCHRVEGIKDLASPESPQEMLIGALCLKARATTDLISAVLK